MKLTKRKAFNFFRSYYDVYNELEKDSDKIAFIDALLDRQFQGIKPTNLKGLAKFAYISQTNSIDSQVSGYETKTKTKLTPCVGGAKGANVGASVQVQVEGEEKGQEEVESYDFDLILNTLNEIFNFNKRVFSEQNKTKYKSTFKQGYSIEDVITAMKSCKVDSFHKDSKYRYCTIEYFSRPKTLDMHNELPTIEDTFDINNPPPMENRQEYADWQEQRRRALLKTF